MLNSGREFRQSSAFLRLLSLSLRHCETQNDHLFNAVLFFEFLVQYSFVHEAQLKGGFFFLNNPQECLSVLDFA